MVEYDRSEEARLRFGVFKRREPGDAKWVETVPGVIFHVANTWDEYGAASEVNDQGEKQAVLAEGKEVVAVNMLVCRMNSASLVFAAGNLPAPLQEKEQEEAEECLLHYYQFSLPSSTTSAASASKITLTHSFPLSSIPFEFPTISPHTTMRDAQYVYGCTMRDGSFSESLAGSGAKIQCLAKVDVRGLIRRGVAGYRDIPGGRERNNINDNNCSRGPGPVDRRSVREILDSQSARLRRPSPSSPRMGGSSRDTEIERDDENLIKIFDIPPGWCCQEATFVPRSINPTSTSHPIAHSNSNFDEEEEDDGYLLTYVFNESRFLNPHTNMPLKGAHSELWIIDAKGMENVIARIVLPQRVPYGFHGTFFTESQIEHQRPVPSIRSSSALTPTSVDLFTPGPAPPYSSSPLVSSSGSEADKKLESELEAASSKKNGFDLDLKLRRQMAGIERVRGTLLDGPLSLMFARAVWESVAGCLERVLV